MDKKEKNSLIWYEFSIFKKWPELIHGVSTRYGGQSGPMSNDLNLAFNEVDTPENVIANISKIETAFKIPQFSFVKQTHSKNVLCLNKSAGYKPRTPQDVQENFDAIIALEQGISLMVKLADCQGIILFEPVKKMLALIHSGWRGSVQNIIGATVEIMQNHGADVSEIRAGISPSLGPCCAEFVNYKQELPLEFQRFMIKNSYFDFWAISHEQLTSVGIKAEHIEIAGLCTKCSDDFFSYRRGDKWQRIGLFAAIMP